jgi:hypothetical protein
MPFLRNALLVTLFGKCVVDAAHITPPIAGGSPFPHGDKLVHHLRAGRDWDQAFVDGFLLCRIFRLDPRTFRRVPPGDRTQSGQG